jgi:hypothetical protein
VVDGAIHGARVGGGVAVSVLARRSSFSPKPELYAPAALILIRGQAESADVDPGNRLPDRATPGGGRVGAAHKALDAWDTKVILAWIGPQGWMNPAAGQVPKDTGNGAPPGGDVKRRNNGGDLPVPQPPARAPR